MKADPHGDPFLAEAYFLCDRGDTLSFYKNWAENYDAHVEQNLNWVAPGVLARQITPYLTPSTTILDVGCGTGLTAYHLKKVDDYVFDGIDFSSEMLDIAHKRGLYRVLYNKDLNQPIDLPDKYYDAAVSSGTFTYGHVGPKPIDEILRLLRPGGYFAFTVHTEAWSDMGFDEHIRSLAESNTVKILESKVDLYIASDNPNGIYCLLQKQ